MVTMTHDSVVATASSRTRTGLAFALVSALSFGTAGALARGLLEAGWSTGAAVTVRALVAAAVLIVPAWRGLDGRWQLIRGNALLLIAYGGIAVAGTQWFYFNAVAVMPVGLALLIEYTAPVAVVGWLWARYGHRPGWLTALGAVVSAVGLVLVLDVLGGVTLNPVGVAWALAAMVGAAFYFVISAQEGNGLPPLVLAAGGLLVGGVLLLLAGLVGLVSLAWSTQPVTYAVGTVAWWVPVLALGVVAGAVPYTTGIAAGRRLGSRLASFVALTEVLAAIGFAWLLLGELPGPVQLVGGLLIVGGVVVVKLGEGAATAVGRRRPGISARPDDG